MKTAILLAIGLLFLAGCVDNTPIWYKDIDIYVERGTFGESHATIGAPSSYGGVIAVSFSDQDVINKIESKGWMYVGRNENYLEFDKK